MQSLGGFLQPQGPEGYQDMFQQMYVDPAMQTFEQQVLPSIQQRFTDANAGSSSALNQALAQSASDLSTSLGSQFGQFMQGQQSNQLTALSQFLPLLTGQTFSPIIQERQGIAGPLAAGVGQGLGMGAGYFMSSKTVKENVRDYKKSLAELKKLIVKQYDYIEDVGGQKDKVGLIAEDLPEELTAVKDGILHVDLYGLMGLLINSIKVLDKRLEKLEDK